jgi:hypothetical protein
MYREYTSATVVIELSDFGEWIWPEVLIRFCLQIMMHLNVLSYIN